MKTSNRSLIARHSRGEQKNISRTFNFKEDELQQQRITPGFTTRTPRSGQDQKSETTKEEKMRKSIVRFNFYIVFTCRMIALTE